MMMQRICQRANLILKKTEEIINGKIFFKDIFRFSFMLILNWYSLNEKIDKNIKVSI